MPTERYGISLKPSTEDGNKKKGKKDESVEQKSEVLPEPKTTKIDETTFCISLNNELTVFRLMTLEEKQLKKVKLSFDKKEFKFHEDIKFVEGNNSELIYVGLSN